MPRTKDDYVFFWRTTDRAGWAAQWYKHAPFTATVELPAPYGECTFAFPTAEHWMMAQKALLFGDLDAFWLVVGVEDPIPGPAGSDDARMRTYVDRQSPPGPKAAKALGRAVRGFDEQVWERERERVVREGNLEKFRQNAREREMLLGTGERMIVEASPRDRIWGVGFKEENAMRNRERWGLNLLGKALMEVRAIMRAEAEAEEA
ncbi:hypothetical protein CERSUDRAFT_87736 [Gelatoporia subvermispora B]|uniref:NADAR domain-containing protein n=1 Tax=Ceriporiopsis subvermispora (strain B) TaxID=914234 RepID=M2PAZ1_CERS8|nr:hypothetical protein CERSUDRAFT_87736 [Gelatoporia subvermispora B]